MPGLYTEYNSYPGRQIRYMVVPRMFEPIFFEGVQSADFASNADEVTHGQFGYKSDVIVTRDYQNTSGTFSLKEFNNASYVLRAMTGAEPASSFLFDSSRLEHVDVFGNVFNKARTDVLRSTWLVDFMPQISESESLDDIQTKDIAYTAIRKLDFEGYQIVCEAFAGSDRAPDGATDFQLMYPALVDPTCVSVSQTTRGMTVGKQRHDLCPIQWALRVWVDGVVIEDPEEATIFTVTVSGAAVSTLRLKTPLPVTGSDHIVKVMWLAKGDAKISQTGVTQAPVMVSAEPVIDASTGGIDATAASSTPTGPVLVVYLSKAIQEDPTTLAGAFTFYSVGTGYLNPDRIEAFTGGFNSDNRLELVMPSTFASGWSKGTPATLTFTPPPNMTDIDGYEAPTHVIDLTW